MSGLVKKIIHVKTVNKNTSAGRSKAGGGLDDGVTNDKVLNICDCKLDASKSVMWICIWVAKNQPKSWETWET